MYVLSSTVMQSSTDLSEPCRARGGILDSDRSVNGYGVKALTDWTNMISQFRSGEQ